MGGRAQTLVTCLTAQDTRDVHALDPTPADRFAAQRDTLLADVSPDAIKIGLLGSAAVAEHVRRLLSGFDGPVVLDPVLAAGGGYELGGDAMASLIREQLLPLVTLATPNRAELRRLAGLSDEPSAAARLLDTGCGALLVTGADETTGDRVDNRLLTADGTEHTWQWARLPHRYHGSGCTLASASAAGLARGLALFDAAERAQEFTWEALRRAEPLGTGQWIPRRSR